MNETPNTVHGRLLESAHIAGYTFKRAWDELKWLLQDDRWKGLGFRDGAAFAESIYGLFSEFKGTVEQRKEVSVSLAGIASQRAIAKVLGVSKDTVAGDLGKRGGENSPAPTDEAAEVGDVDEHGGENSPQAAFQRDVDPYELAKKEAKKEDKKQERESSNNKIRSGARPLPDGKFSVIYADPPWTFQVWSGEGKDRAAENHYPTMTQAEIEALPVADLAADDCALFMWAVMPQLPEALKVIEAWGFEYKTCAFVWVKQTKDGDRFATGMGYWTRANAEICLLATRGSPQRLNADVHQVVASPRMEHSRKPDEVATRIERLIGGPYIELFARAPRPGWSAWGNQAEEPDPLDIPPMLRRAV